MFWNRNNIITGLILGLLIPLTGYWLIKGGFELLTQIGAFDPTGFSESWRARTISLLAICLNIIPFNLYRRRRFDESMRGLIFPTVLFVGIWVFWFKDFLFQNI